MKPCLLPLLALALLLGACSSPPPVSSYPPRPAIPTGIVSTVWGPLPTYDQFGHSFRNLAGRPPVNTFDAKLTIDLLVDKQGSVRDVALVASSGNPGLDRRVMSRLEKAQYSPQLAPDDPAPHVVRLVVDFSAQRDPHLISGYPSDNLNGSGPTPTFAGPASVRPGEPLKP